MSGAIDKATGEIVGMIASSFMGEPAAAPVMTPEERADQAFDFSPEFQTKIAAFAIRSDDFMRRVGHLIKPEYFENVGEAVLVNIALRHLQKYRELPDNISLKTSLFHDAKSNIVRGEALKLAIGSFSPIFLEDLRNSAYVEEQVARFAKHQAMGAAIMKSIELREKNDFAKIEELVLAAASIGISENGEGYDYSKRIGDRTMERLDKVSGVRPPQGITTGIPKLDSLLYHNGWGRKELTSIMGGAKAGKTTALISFGKAASLAKHNVLYATLEVGASIISDRLDASISQTLMKELNSNIHGIREKVELATANAGALMIHEYASGTLTPNMLRKLIESYKTPGLNSDGSPRPPIKFDLVIVDYADIMAPNFRTQDTIENSKTVYVDLRAIAFEENCAVLTATQTNRTGFTAAVAKAEHVSEDFNKVRTVDLLISINKTEEEAKRNEARLYFAASRNQESGFTVSIKQNLAMMVFVESVVGVE